MCEWELKFYMNLARQMRKLVCSDGDASAGVNKVKFYYRLQ